MHIMHMHMHIIRVASKAYDCFIVFHQNFDENDITAINFGGQLVIVILKLQS